MCGVKYIIPEYSVLAENQWTNQKTQNYRSPSSTKTTKLNGKIELGGLMFVKGTAAFMLEFEQPISNSNLMWLLQIGGGGLLSHETSLRAISCPRGDCSEVSGSSFPLIPYGLFFTGFRYHMIAGLTASIAIGTKTFQNALWVTPTIGWNIMNKVHIELGLSAIYIQPVMLSLSVGIPFKKW